MQRRMNHTVTLFTVNGDAAIRTRAKVLTNHATMFKLSLVQFWQTHARLHHIPVLSSQECGAVWSSAVMAHLLKSSTYCTFRDTFLHILGCNGWLFEWLLPSSQSKQSGYSPARLFNPKTCCTMDFFRPLSLPGKSWPQQPCHIQFDLNRICLHFDNRFQLQVILTMSTRLNARVSVIW